jgi:TetR/AcrR family transcriptional regulator, tetracycline repressor protein
MLRIPPDPWIRSDRAWAHLELCGVQMSPPNRAPVPRAPWGTISREQVVAAATRAVAKGGFEKMTMRSLAADLGVAPMSLYNHVRDKDDLLEDVIDGMLAKAWKPRAKTSDWQTWIAEAAEKLRHFLVSQPAALHVYLRHPVVSPAAVARMAAMMDVFHKSGINDDVADRAYAAVHTYTIGFAALQASRGRWERPTETIDPLAARLGAYTNRQQFAVGLRYLLEGVERECRG